MAADSRYLVTWPTLDVKELVLDSKGRPALAAFSEMSGLRYYMLNNAQLTYLETLLAEVATKLARAGVEAQDQAPKGRAPGG